MDRNQRLMALLREARDFAACLDDAALSAAVPPCPGWTVRELTAHLGEVHAWAALATRASERPVRAQIDWPAGAAALADRFLAGAAVLADALDGPSSTPAWSFSAPHQTLEFWQRRQVVETAVHRWDAQSALGRAEGFVDGVALDGLDELAEVMVPLRISRGQLATDASVAFVADGVGRWQLGQGQVVAEVRGSASDLLLLGWGRLDADAPGLAWSGDEACREFVRGGLTP